MNYPRDITQLVNDLAATPGVHRVFIALVEPNRLSKVVVWPAKFKTESPILLKKGCVLHVEGEWIADPLSVTGDAIGFLNKGRILAGLSPLSCIAEITNGTLEDGKWSGDIQFGFSD